MIPAKEDSAGEHAERNESGLPLERNVRGTGRDRSVHASQLSGLGKLPSSLVPRFPLRQAKEDNNAYGIVLW